MTERDRSYALRFDGMAWKRLEMEEQAFARKLVREGWGIIEGQGSDRRFVLKQGPVRP